MTTRTVTLDRLEEIALNAEAQIAVDPVRRVAYLRRGQVMLVAPLAEEQAA